MFKITNYCSCYECNGKWTGYLTTLGTDYIEGETTSDKLMDLYNQYFDMDGEE